MTGTFVKFSFCFRFPFHVPTADGIERVSAKGGLARGYPDFRVTTGLGRVAVRVDFLTREGYEGEDSRGGRTRKKETED